MTVAPVSSVPLATPALRPEAAPVLATAGVATTTATGSAQSGAAQLAASPETLPGAGSPPPPTAALALDAPAFKAAALAALSDGGLARLMADLSQALRIPGLPGSVQTAITQILALRAPLDAPPTVADIKAALAQSNFSPTSPTAAASALPQALLAAISTDASGGPLKNALLGLQQALKSWVATVPAQPLPNAVGSPSNGAPPQGAASPLVADLAQAVRTSGLPAPVQAALLQALDLPPSAAAPPESGSAPISVQAGAAAPPTSPAVPTPSVQGGALPAGLKLAMPAVEQALQALLDATPAAGSAPAEVVSPPAGASAAEIAENGVPTAADPALAAAANIEPTLPPSAPLAMAGAPSGSQAPAVTSAPALAASAAAETILSALPPNIDPKAVMAVFQQVAEAWLEAAPPKPSAASPAAAGSASDSAPLAASPSLSANAAKAPPPPFRGGPTTAQPSVPSALPANADPVTVVNRLMRETNAAIAHQELLQLASLPATTQAPTQTDSQNPQWMFEIPFATPQGSAVAQFKISRDGNGKTSKGVLTPVWRAQFSLDVEPMGPVHAQIVLAGDRTWVSLWAERADSAARLRQHEALLTTSLSDANFVAEIAFHTGAPRQPATNAGRFLDHAS
jgi:hypothetical protein